MKLWETLKRVISGTNGMSVSMPIQGTGVRVHKMRNLPKLIQTIIRVYENPAYAPVIKDGKVEKTFCNFAIRDICGTLGYHAFEGMLADQIYAHMRKSQDWVKIEMKDAQFLANQGTLVIAALPSVMLDAAHGHVCVVRPGEDIYSSKWDARAPVCINIGAQNFILRFKTSDGKFIEAGVNGAFSKQPYFFAWKDSL